MQRLLAALAAIAVLATGGCASIVAARLYRDGSEALERGDAVAALVALERAAELVPEASEVQNHLGLAYLATGRPQEARLAFERAVALDCDNTAARHNLDLLRRR